MDTRKEGHAGEPAHIVAGRGTLCPLVILARFQRLQTSVTLDRCMSWQMCQTCLISMGAHSPLSFKAKRHIVSCAYLCRTNHFVACRCISTRGWPQSGCGKHAEGRALPPQSQPRVWVWRQRCEALSLTSAHIPMAFMSTFCLIRPFGAHAFRFVIIILCCGPRPCCDSWGNSVVIGSFSFPAVPPRADLEYEVELLDFDPANEVLLLSPVSKIQVHQLPADSIAGYGSFSNHLRAHVLIQGAQPVTSLICAAQ